MAQRLMAGVYNVGLNVPRDFRSVRLEYRHDTMQHVFGNEVCKVSDDDAMKAAQTYTALLNGGPILKDLADG